MGDEKESKIVLIPPGARGLGSYNNFGEIITSYQLVTGETMNVTKTNHDTFKVEKNPVAVYLDFKKIFPEIKSLNLPTLNFEKKE